MKDIISIIKNLGQIALMKLQSSKKLLIAIIVAAALLVVVAGKSILNGFVAIFAMCNFGVTVVVIVAMFVVVGAGLIYKARPPILEGILVLLACQALNTGYGKLVAIGGLAYLPLAVLATAEAVLITYTITRTGQVLKKMKE